MVKRLFWLAMGVTIGALVVRKLSQAAERMTPGSVGQRLIDGLGDLSESLRDTAAEIRAAAQERETELRKGTGLDGRLGRAEPS